jgi:NADPH-dependent 2,4-dienoyl-CoA reductase/sulfur reductase-like enzyme
MQRRHFLRTLGAGAAGLAAMRAAFGADSTSGYVAPVPADTGAVGHVIVIGAGMAGASAAKYLRVWGGQRVKVTLIERAPSYVSNIMSNLVLNGSKTIGGLTYGWDKLVANYGVTRLQAEVAGIDAAGHTVTLAGGQKIAYDRLVIAPGIAFDAIPGLTTDALRAQFPHAWQAGAQTTTLRDQIRAMPAGGRFVMTIPKAPYRCPPGPYERACVVADWLKRNRPGSKVIVLDENPAITAEKESFTRAFEVTHKGVVEYVPNATLLGVDPATRTVLTAMGDFQGNVLNPIPRQRAPKVLADAGMLNAANLGETEVKWVKVDAKSYEHLDAARFPHVHVIGDPATHGMPKAGHVANVEAKVCADAITRYLRGDRPMDNPVANSACYSPITFETASWLTAMYQYDSSTRQMKVREYATGKFATGEAGVATKDNFEEMNKWFRQLMADSFA